MRIAIGTLVAIGTLALLGLMVGQSTAVAEPGQKPLGLGQLVVNDRQTGAAYRLNLARYHVHVVLQPPLALVQIDQSFFNPFPRQQEGTYAFNLPEGASVCRFAMYTTPQLLIEGELIERARAANIYQSIVNRQRDPAILEQIGENLFRMRVFPIPPQDTKRILFDYTVPLVEDEDGHYAFRLPMMSDLEPVWDFALTGSIRGPNVAASVESPSHPELRFSADDKNAINFAINERSYRPESAFTLRFQQRPTEEATVRSFVPAPPSVAPTGDALQENATAPPQECKFMATISQAVIDAGAADDRLPPSPADVLILADTSGRSRDRTRLRQDLQTIVGSLRPQDRFRLGCIDVAFRSLTKDWIAAQSPASEAALAHFEREFLLGEMAFAEGLSSAIKSLPAAEAGRRRLIVYVGDGVLPAKNAAPADVLKTLVPALTHSKSCFCAVLGQDEMPGRVLMQQLAAATGGRLFRLAAGNTREELRDWAIAGCPFAVKIIAVKAEGVADEDLYLPEVWLPRHCLRIFGRRKNAGLMRLQITFERDGKTESRHWTLKLKNDSEDVFVGRMWAERRIEELRQHEILATGDENSRRRDVASIVALSQEWTLLSPHTAFLVLENEAEYPSYGINRQFRHKYWKPGDSAHAEPIPPQALQALKLVRNTRRPITAEQFEEALAAARQALRNRSFVRAQALLRRVSSSLFAAQSKEFADLQKSAERMQKQTDLLANLGSQRGWFERQPPIGFDSPLRDFVWKLIYGFGARGRDDDRQPLALSRQFEPPDKETTLESFIEWVEQVSGANVVFDRATLADEGIALDHPIDFRGIHSMSLQSLMTHAFAPIQLTCLVEDNDLVVTTIAKASEELRTRLYPVSDLIVSGGKTDYSLLANVELDREQSWTHRLQEKLNQRISINFKNMKLSEAFNSLAEKVNDNFVIDRPTLTDEGVELDVPVTLNMRNVFLHRILEHLCQPKQLRVVVENEAIVITTMAKAGAMLHTRLHPAQGVVFRIPPQLWKKENVEMWGWDPRFMGIGGMQGGLGGNALAGGGQAPGAAGMQPIPPLAGAGAGPVNERVSIGISQSVGSDAAAAPDDKESGLESKSRSASLINDDDSFEDIDFTVMAGTFGQPRPMRFRPDTSKSMIELIVNTIEPDKWEDSSVMYYPGATVFAVRQTDAVHEQIARLIEQLRNLPPVFEEKGGYLPDQVPVIDHKDVRKWDLKRLLTLLTTTIEPESWESLSGPGTMQAFYPRLALSIRQTPAVHAEIQKLLTQLRRARFLAIHGRDFRPIDFEDFRALTERSSLIGHPVGIRQSELPEPEEAQIKALEVLRDPPAGVQTWRTVPSLHGRSQTTRLRLDRARDEFEFDGRVARVDGDEAVIACPGIKLIERGAWGEALRRLIDGRLPWLPHRSRRELARMFDVNVVGGDDQAVQLRLRLRGEAAGNEILVAVSRRHGLLTSWESRLDGQPVMRLRFADFMQAGDTSLWTTIIAEDPAGRELERWELVDYQDRDFEVLPLNVGWGSYIAFDLRDQPHAESPLLIQILHEIRQRDWAAVDRDLDAALLRQPGQPLLLFVKAWGLTQREGKYEAEVFDLLKEVARGGGNDLLLSLSDGNFATLPEARIYEILLELPAASRRPVDCDNLARVARQLGRFDEAVGHLRQAITETRPANDFKRELLLIELLLETSHASEASALAETIAARPGIISEDVVTLAETLYKGRARDEGAKLMQQALAQSDISGERRGIMLRRGADLETGLIRWRTLVEAIETVPPDSIQRGAFMNVLLGELNDLKQFDQLQSLAREARDRGLKAALFLRQAELSAARSDFAAASDAGWKVYESKELPINRIEWLCGVLASAREHERLIQVVEDRLLSSGKVEPRLLDWVALAYEAVGRSEAARRAATNPRDIHSPVKY